MDLYEVCRQIRGFNYFPSYCLTAFDMWDKFDTETWRTEIGRGKKYFPKLNTLRVWLDWTTYGRLRDAFVQHLGTVLDICGDLDIKLMPTLFDRWHNPSDYINDWGGIYFEQFIDRNFTRFEQYLNYVAGDLQER